MSKKNSKINFTAYHYGKYYVIPSCGFYHVFNCGSITLTVRIGGETLSYEPGTCLFSFPKSTFDLRKVKNRLRGFCDGFDITSPVYSTYFNFPRSFYPRVF